MLERNKMMKKMEMNVEMIIERMEEMRTEILG